MSASQRVEVVANAVRDIPEADVATGLAKPAEISLGKALVRTLQVLWKRDIANPAFAVPVDDGARHVVKTLRAASAGVVHAGHVTMLKKPEVHIANVIDVNKIALLLAITIAIVAFEQAHFAVFPELLVKVKRDARHRAFVLFARPVHVEIPQADSL